MNLLRFGLLFLVLILVGCSSATIATIPSTETIPVETPTFQNNEVNLAQLTNITTPSFRPTTLTPIIQPTRSPNPTSTNVPTATEEIYPFKTVWISWGLGYSCCSYFDMVFNTSFPTFVIYTDNQMLLYHKGAPILEKKLSNDEICNLLITLNASGLNQIKSDGINPDDAIYTDAARHKWGTDAAYYGLTINGMNQKHLAIYEPVKDEVIQPVKDIMSFLNTYQPKSMQPYHPDRLAVYVGNGRIFPTLDKIKSLSWPQNLPPLSTSIDQALYLKGSEADQLYALIGMPLAGTVFIDQGIEYSVFIRPALPGDLFSGGPKNTGEPIQISPTFGCKYDLNN